MEHSQARQLATVMGQITHNISQHYQSDLLPRFNSNNISLTTRVGSGRATYCKKDGSNYYITYGAAMVRDKTIEQHCSGWLTSREIEHRGYFNGDITYANLLSHTIAHEFCHVLQFEYPGRRRKRAKVHNAVFYGLLDELYANGTGENIKAELLSAAESQQLPLSFVIRAEAVYQTFYRGQAVSFLHRGQEHQGFIKRCNKYTHTIAIHQANGIQEWRVPHHGIYPTESEAIAS